MYKIPICDCGEPLFIYDEEIIKVYQPVTKMGLPSKRKINDYDGSNNIYERLVCRECGNEFWMDEDSKGRIIKGESFYV